MDYEDLVSRRDRHRRQVLSMTTNERRRYVARRKAKGATAVSALNKILFDLASIDEPMILDLWKLPIVKRVKVKQEKGKVVELPERFELKNAQVLVDVTHLPTKQKKV
jgi:hypothetical protein